MGLLCPSVTMTTSVTLVGAQESMNICDSKWLWEGGECVEITGDIDRVKILK